MKVLAILSALLLSGCAAKTALDVATLPVKAAVKVGEVAWDTATESREERDLKRGRELRRQEEAAAREAKEQDRARRKAAREAEREAARDAARRNPS
jgi:hypothetical protein